MSDSIDAAPRGLTKERVVAVALEVARTEGFGGVTMRGVATQLDVTPMALYYHVSDKEELLELVADEVISGAPKLDPDTTDWEVDLRHVLLERWRILIGYPGLASYMLTGPRANTNVASHTSVFFENLGFSPRDARLMASFVFTYLLGRLSIDARVDDSSEGNGDITPSDYASFGVESVISAVRSALAERVAS